MTPGRSNQPLNVIGIVGENDGAILQRNCDHGGIYNIRSFRCCQQASSLMCAAFAQGHDPATAEETPELSLFWGAAYLGHDGRRYEGDEANLKPCLVFCPGLTVVSICCHEHGGIVDEAAHAGRRVFRDAVSCPRTRRRAAFISSSLNRPCCSSH